MLVVRLKEENARAQGRQARNFRKSPTDQILVSLFFKLSSSIAICVVVARKIDGKTRNEQARNSEPFQSIFASATAYYARSCMLQVARHVINRGAEMVQFGFRKRTSRTNAKFANAN